MNNNTYPNIKQSLLLFVFFFTSFALFFFLAGSLPQILGFHIPKLYMSLVFYVASPIATLPLIIYVNKKSGGQLKWPIKLPSIRVIIVLVILAVTIKLISIPLTNPLEYFSNLTNGRLKLVVFTSSGFDLNIAIKIIITVLIVPIFEEIFWRRQILGLFLKKYSPSVSIVISSILFAVGHLRFNEIGTLFIWGLIFSIVYYKTSSLESSILLHSFAISSSFIIKHEFVEITGLLLFKYILLMAGSLLIILLIIKYLKRYGMAKTINSTEITDASLPAGG